MLAEPRHVIGPERGEVDQRRAEERLLLVRAQHGELVAVRPRADDAQAMAGRVQFIAGRLQREHRIHAGLARDRMLSLVDQQHDGGEQGVRERRERLNKRNVAAEPDPVERKIETADFRASQAGATRQFRQRCLVTRDFGADGAHDHVARVGCPIDPKIDVNHRCALLDECWREIATYERGLAGAARPRTGQTMTRRWATRAAPARRAVARAGCDEK